MDYKDLSKRIRTTIRQGFHIIICTIDRHIPWMGVYDNFSNTNEMNRNFYVAQKLRSSNIPNFWHEISHNMYFSIIYDCSSP